MLKERGRASRDARPLLLGARRVSRSASTAAALWRACRRHRRRRRAALRRGPLLAALAGGAAWPPIRNDLQAVVEPEVASVREGLALLRRAGDALAVAMSGSGPSLFALFPDQAAAEAARQSLAADLEAAGFEAWSCRFTGSGVSLGA